MKVWADVIARKLPPASVAPPPAPGPVAAGQVYASESFQTKMQKIVSNPHRAPIDIERICGLPLWTPMDADALEAFNRENLLASAYAEGFRFFPIQAEAIRWWDEKQGLFAPIGVGFGKTLISLAIASRAFRAGIQKILLLVPSQVYRQLTMHDIAWARKRVPMQTPFFALGGKDRKQRQGIVRSHRPGTYILPYSLCSSTDADDLFENIAPGLVIMDEAHSMKNRGSAKTKRLIRYLDRNGPKVVAMSGTMTSKSLLDYHHLLKYALGSSAPVPMLHSHAAEWASVIDATATYLGDGSTRPLQPLLHWAIRNYPLEQFPPYLDGYRKSYRKRLTSAPGVVATSDESIGTSLTISNQPAPEPGERLRTLITNLEKLWQTPNGDEIDHAIQTYKWNLELSSGFYNELTWPDAVTVAQSRGVSLPAAERLLAMSLEHHILCQEYNKRLREFLSDHSLRGLDTPMQVGRYLVAGKALSVLPSILVDAWREKQAAAFPELVLRESKQNRVDDFKIKHAVRWAQGCAGQGNGGGILWTFHQEIGRWLVEELKLVGIDPLHCPAGDVANKAIADTNNAHRIVVASISAHGTGKNLQHFQRQMVVQWPRSAVVAEQMLGRTHRSGQTADELDVVRCDTLEFDRLLFSACLNDSLLIHQTEGRQKLIYAAYDPLPTIYPSAFLRERGFQNQILTTEQAAALEDRFSAG